MLLKRNIYNTLVNDLWKSIRECGSLYLSFKTHPISTTKLMVDKLLEGFYYFYGSTIILFLRNTHSYLVKHRSGYILLDISSYTLMIWTLIPCYRTLSRDMTEIRRRGKGWENKRQKKYKEIWILRCMRLRRDNVWGTKG